jgi:hypothetical protein
MQANASGRAGARISAPGRPIGFERCTKRGAVFHRLDRHRDGVLSPEELENIDSATLTDLDRNRDGKGGLRRMAKFECLNIDRDGRVYADGYFERGGEWRRMAAATGFGIRTAMISSNQPGGNRTRSCSTA